jgi:hypothetical protein
MRLEERVTGNRVTYVDRIKFDSQSKRLTLYLVLDPERGTVARVLTFTHVEDFRVLEERADPDLLDSLLGIEEERRGKGTQFLIALEQSEMSFYTAAEPEIEDLPG